MRANAFNSRTCTDVQARFFDTFFTMYSLLVWEKAALIAGYFPKGKPAAPKRNVNGFWQTTSIVPILDSKNV